MNENDLTSDKPEEEIGGILENAEQAYELVKGIESMFVDLDEQGREIVGSACEDEETRLLINNIPRKSSKLMDYDKEETNLFRATINIIIERCSFEGTETSRERERIKLQQTEESIKKFSSPESQTLQSFQLKHHLMLLISRFHIPKKSDEPKFKEVDFKKFYTGNK